MKNPANVFKTTLRLLSSRKTTTPQMAPLRFGNARRAMCLMPICQLPSVHIIGKIASRYGSLCALLIGATLSPGVSWAGTVAWWRFEEGVPNAIATGSGTVLDSAGGFNATPYGGPVYRSVNIPGCVPPSTLALEFNGSNSFLSVPDNVAFYLTNSLTLEAFILFHAHPVESSMWSQIVFRGDDRPGYDPYCLGVSPDGRLWFHLGDASNNTADLLSPSPISTNQFMHVAGTFDGSSGQMTLFINGSQVAAQTTSITPLAALQPGYSPGIGIGNTQSAAYTEYFWGLIDEVRISDVALAPSQFLYTNIAPAMTIQLGVQLAWPSQTNLQYQMQASSALSSNSWINLGASVPGTGTTNYFFDPLGPSNSFYRLLVLP